MPQLAELQKAKGLSDHRTKQTNYGAKKSLKICFEQLTRGGIFFNAWCLRVSSFFGTEQKSCTQEALPRYCVLSDCGNNGSIFQPLSTLSQCTVFAAAPLAIGSAQRGAPDARCEPRSFMAIVEMNEGETYAQCQWNANAAPLLGIIVQAAFRCDDSEAAHRRTQEPHWCPLLCPLQIMWWGFLAGRRN